MSAESFLVPLAKFSSRTWGAWGLPMVAHQPLMWEESGMGIWLGLTRRECGNRMLDYIMSPTMC